MLYLRKREARDPYAYITLDSVWESDLSFTCVFGLYLLARQNWHCLHHPFHRLCPRKLAAHWRNPYLLNYSLVIKFFCIDCVDLFTISLISCYIVIIIFICIFSICLYMHMYDNVCHCVHYLCISRGKNRK